MTVRRRKLDLGEKNPGAVFGSDPKIILTKMLRRPQFYPTGSRMEKICTARPKFNDALNEAAAKFDFNIMNVTACTRPDHFEHNGRKLSEAGKNIFWRELDHLLERFDRNEIQLLPSAQVRQNQSGNQDRDRQCRFKQATNDMAYQN